MNIVIIILTVLASIIALLLIIGAFTKKDYTVERDVVINRPKAEVFDYIKYINNSEQYSKWVMMDPNSKRERRGEDGTVGFVYAWDSKMKNVGAGEQEIISLEKEKRIVCELRFIRPFEATSEAIMATESAGTDGTKLTWTFNGHMKYPLNVMLLFMNFDKSIGADMQISLSNLKQLLENNQAAPVMGTP